MANKERVAGPSGRANHPYQPDIQLFLKHQLQALHALYPASKLQINNPVVIDTYVDMLKEYPFDELQTLFGQAPRQFKFFPTVAELYTLIHNIHAEARYQAKKDQPQYETIPPEDRLPIEDVRLLVSELCDTSDHNLEKQRQEARIKRLELANRRLCDTL